MRVGNGENIRIWSHKWLPKPITGCVQSHIKILQAEDRVCELIDKTSRGWKVDLVRQIFERDETDLILSLPISPVETDDRLIWGYSKDGKFSIQSAYHMIWKLGVPNATKLFLWKVANNILPTMINLRQRRVIVTPPNSV
ncbi:hypothetical protein I3843_11G050400 [Carya illinoinensis]|nr:hypothetical protein I3843_11G050400 [Carya illinoinensis]